jgi:Ni/Fe-hydrogenase subunit HybB-like protein
MSEASFIFPNDAHVAWSIMIVLYPYITGLVAGAFVVSALYHVFHREALKPVARLALVTSLCFCSFATVPLLLHLHRPERAFNVMITPSGTSAMAGFGFIYSLYMLVLIVEVWLVFRPEIAQRGQTTGGLLGLIYRTLALGVKEVRPESKRLDDKVIHFLALAGIPIACILHGYVGFLFGAIKANPWWSTALMPVIFLISAIVSGIGGLIVLYLLASWWRKVPADQDCVRALAKYLWMFLVGAVTLELLEVVHMAYESSGEWHVISTLLQTRLAVTYGVIQLAIGSLIPLALLPLAFWSKLGRRSLFAVSSLSSVLVLIQVFAMRWNVVVGGQLFSKSFRGFTTYQIEWLGREGLLAAIIVLTLPVIALGIASRLLPLWEPEPAHS